MSSSLANLSDAQEWFEVLQTTTRSQTAVMTLAPGQASGHEPEVHASSDQVLLLIEGELSAEIAGEQSAMKRGDVLIVPAGTGHRFINPGKTKAVTFSVYAPPAYPAGEKG